LAHDVTDRKRAEEGIRFQTARFKQLFDNAPLSILQVDENDRVVDANREFEKTFQFSLEEMRGRPANDIVLPDTNQEEGATYSASVLRGDTIAVETVRRRKDGSLIPVQIYGLPIIVDQNPAGVFAIYVDLSESKRAQERISRLAKIVESSSDSIVGS